jgi:hypothetical protein
MLSKHLRMCEMQKKQWTIYGKVSCVTSFSLLEVFGFGVTDGVSSQVMTLMANCNVN